MPRVIDLGGLQAPGQYKKVFSEFRGVDFSADPAQISDSRSPWAVNLVGDAAGCPEKRVGWRVLVQTEGRINGIYFAVLAGGSEGYFVHAGQNLYSWKGDTDQPVLVGTGLNDARSTSFLHGGRLFLLDGAHYWVVQAQHDEGEEPFSLCRVAELAFVPTTVIGAPPAGGGTPFEEVNLLTGRRKNSFAADGTSTVYQLDGTELTEDAVRATVNGTAMEEGAGLTVDRAAGTVTFDEAPAAYEGGTGVDNVVVEFTAKAGENPIECCTTAAFYGFWNDNRVFVCGNPAYPNTDYQSGLDDPTYFPDRGYTKVGADTAAILGYLKQGDSLIIVKEDNDQDAAIFVRTAQMTEDNQVIFPLRQGAKGVGAASRTAFASLSGDPLFLAREGVYAVTSNSVTSERAVKERSRRINKVLTEKDNLSEAVAAVWNGLYLLCVDGVCFVADSSRGVNDGGYEWYYWDNIPTRVFCEKDGTLYFGREDGALCRFSNDIDTMSRYYDDGAPIVARWTTKAEDCGDFTRQKTLLKRGTGVLIRPYTRSSVKISVITDVQPETFLGKDTMDIFTFEDIDFSRIDFNTRDTAQLKPFGKKVRRFNLIQLVFENDVGGEGFGVFGASLVYTWNNYVK